MTKTKGLARGFRSDKGVTASVESTATAVTAVTVAALAPVHVHAPGSQEKIDELIAKQEALNHGDFKTAQNFDTEVRRHDALIAHHTAIQTARVAAQERQQLDKVPGLEETLKNLTSAAAQQVKTITALNTEIDRLRLRLPSADLWDAQEEKRIKDEKAEQERIEKEAAAAVDLKRREYGLAKYQALVAQDEIAAQNEQAEYAARAADIRGAFEQWGQPGCDRYNEHAQELRTRAYNLRHRAYYQKLVADPSFTFAQARAQEENFQRETEAAARQVAGKELTRAHMEPREFSPDLDYIPPPVHDQGSQNGPHDAPTGRVGKTGLRVARDANGNFLYNY